jgi:hypothetical protein
MQMVEHGDAKFDQAWANRVKAFAKERYLQTMRKIDELSDYYLSPHVPSATSRTSSNWSSEQAQPHYEPLHSHDTINLLCRILGVGAETKARA